MHQPDRWDKAKAGNGDFMDYCETEADRERGNYPKDCQGGDQVGYMTNAEMFKLIRRQVEQRHADVTANGCCKLRDEHGFCRYLQQQCPELMKEDGHETD